MSIRRAASWGQPLQERSGPRGARISMVLSLSLDRVAATKKPRRSRRMRENTPPVELIARPSVDLDALERYLKTVGGESWLQMRKEQEDGLNPGQLLIEASGRACYRSWTEGLNPNVKRIRRDQQQYFLNILRSGHGSV